MPGNKYNGNSSIPTTRIERLLKERELRRSSKASHSNEATDSNRGSEVSEHDESNSPRVSYVEQYLEGLAFSERPPRQRLLVVANRLPVSAVRRGEETWSLEISAGGLVSALLGK